ncbi:hypothetical protein ACA910_004139 [Epithemia clementina (nom. ined.)]
MVDKALVWLVSDVGSLVLGTAGLLVVLFGRLFAPPSFDNDIESMAEETRLNLLAILACGAVLSNGLAKVDINTVTAETAVLTGTRFKDPIVLVSSKNDKTNTLGRKMTWLIRALLTATSAESAVVLEQQFLLMPKEQEATPNENHHVWHVLGFGGIISGKLRSSVLADDFVRDQEAPLVLMKGDKTSILNRMAKRPQGEDETYLPNLPTLPGRFEFDSFLPSNTQAALLLPIMALDLGDGHSGLKVLVLGSNQARSFTPKDIAWCRAAVGCLRKDN